MRAACLRARGSIRLTLIEDIPEAHKVALQNIAAGEPVSAFTARSLAMRTATFRAEAGCMRASCGFSGRTIAGQYAACHCSAVTHAAAEGPGAGFRTSPRIMPDGRSNLVSAALHGFARGHPRANPDTSAGHLRRRELSRFAFAMRMVMLRALRQLKRVLMFFRIDFSNRIGLAQQVQAFGFFHGNRAPVLHGQFGALLPPQQRERQTRTQGRTP